MHLTAQRILQLEIWLERIGVQFCNKQLLNCAFIHKSYNYEYKTDENNERLEFLGDSLLNVCITSYLYDNYNDDEGVLSNIRSNVVSTSVLVDIAYSLYIFDCILLGKGEMKNKGMYKHSILASTLEAFIAAYYIDALYSLDTLATVIIPWFIPYIQKLYNGTLIFNYKSYLQEYAQKFFLCIPQYTVVYDAHQHQNVTKLFQVQVTIGSISTIGFGKNKKEAEQNAAYNAWHILQEEKNG